MLWYQLLEIQRESTLNITQKQRNEIEGGNLGAMAVAEGTLFFSKWVEYPLLFIDCIYRQLLNNHNQSNKKNLIYPPCLNPAKDQQGDDESLGKSRRKNRGDESPTQSAKRGAKTRSPMLGGMNNT